MSSSFSPLNSPNIVELQALLGLSYFTHSVHGITNGKTKTQIKKKNAIPVG
jgi:hypothetical protein